MATSGAQFFVEPGKQILVDLVSESPGQEITFEEVLLIGRDGDAPLVGKPNVSGAKVVGIVLDHVKSKKLHVRRYKRRKNFRRHIGHRQPMTAVEIKEIVLPA